MRICVLGLTAALLVGCKTPPPGIDPFLRTRVPPPASGEAAPLYEGDAYDPARQAAPIDQPGQGTYQPPAADEPGTSSAPSQTPYGRQNFPARFRTSASRDLSPSAQDTADGLEPPEVELAVGEAQPQATSVQLAGGSSPAVPRSRVVPANHQSEIRMLTPEDTYGELEASDDGPDERGPGSVPDNAWQGADAPSAAPGQAGRGTQASAGATGSSYAGTSSTSGEAYAYDPDYAWLRGKLEYSQRDRRWKLRYIPVDGSTDQYGGSVVLTNPQKLEGFEPGEFVEVQGVLAGSVGREPFAPAYRIERIVAQEL